VYGMGSVGETTLRPVRHPGKGEAASLDWRLRAIPPMGVPERRRRTIGKSAT